MRHGVVQWAGEAWPDSACSPAAHVLGFAKHADHCCFHWTPQLGQQRSVVRSCGVSSLSIRLPQHLCHQLACAKLAVAVIDSSCLAVPQVWSCFFLCWRESYALGYVFWLHTCDCLSLLPSRPKVRRAFQLPKLPRVGVSLILVASRCKGVGIHTFDSKSGVEECGWQLACLCNFSLGGASASLLRTAGIKQAKGWKLPGLWGATISQFMGQLGKWLSSLESASSEAWIWYCEGCGLQLTSPVTRLSADSVADGR